MTEKKVSPSPFGRMKDLVKSAPSGYESIARERNISPNALSEAKARLKSSIREDLALGIPKALKGNINDFSSFYKMRCWSNLYPKGKDITNKF